MQITKYNNDWLFWKDKDAFSLVWNIPKEARQITLPHDAMIEDKVNLGSPNGTNTGFRDGDTYVYVKMLQVPKDWSSRIVKLKFEGVYMNAFVYVNGQLAAKSPFGYTTFYVKLNDHLKYGDQNEIRVFARAGAMANSRWYSGAGIYRDVYLLQSGLSYIVPEGVQIRTEAVEPDMAFLEIKTELKNENVLTQGMLLESEIRDAKDQIVAAEKTVLSLFRGEERRITQRLAVDNPGLWSEESPELYTCISRLYACDGRMENGEMERGRLLDENKERFGIRTLQADARHGLRVNGKLVHLKGACIHHDSGIIGAATYEDAQFRQIARMKEAGFNAVRMAHNPMAPAMLRACDELGMYVMDEAFDMWSRCKTDHDYALYFQEWWEQDVTAMVRKDYNHPSVILYSIGNEISEIGLDHGAKICYELCRKIKELDASRYTLSAVNGVFAAGDQVERIVADMTKNLPGVNVTDGNVNDFMTLMHAYMDQMVLHDAITEKLDKAFAYTDIGGYNYMEGRYDTEGEKYPNRVIVGSETCPPQIASNWSMVKKHPYIIGDFTWTGWDFLGEAGGFVPARKGQPDAEIPPQVSYVGDIDITGFRKPMSYLREIVFGQRKKPYITVQNPYRKEEIHNPWVLSDSNSSWNWDGCGKDSLVVEVYSAGTEVELLLNNRVISRKPAGEAAGYRILFDVPYEPGTLTAVAYDEAEEIGRMSLDTAGEGRKLVLKKEENPREQELLYFSVELHDEKGKIVPDCDRSLSLHVEGDAVPLGFGSGDPKPGYNYNEGIAWTYFGRALVILRKKPVCEYVKVLVESEDGMRAELVLQLKNSRY